MWVILALQVVVTVSHSLDRLLVRYEAPTAWICIQTEGKIDDKMFPGEFISWWAESCWKPWRRREEYRLRPGTLRYRVCSQEDGLGCGSLVNVRPEEEGLGEPVSPSNPPPGTR